MVFEENQKVESKKTILKLLETDGAVLIIRRDGTEHIRHDMTRRHSFDRIVVLTNMKTIREVTDEETMDLFLEEELAKGDSYDVFPRFIHIDMNFSGNDGRRFKMRPMTLNSYGDVMVQFIYVPYTRQVEIHIENQATDQFALIHTLNNVNISATKGDDFKNFCNLFVKTLDKEEEKVIVKSLNLIVEKNKWSKEDLLV